MRLSRGGFLVVVAFAVVLTAGSPALAQQDVYVNVGTCTGSGNGDPGDPFCEIQEGICALKDLPLGGTVHVSPGTYTEAIRFFPQVSVVSTDGPLVTTIDATGQFCYLSDCTLSTVTPCAVAYFPTGSATNAERLHGFTLTGGGGLNQTCGGNCDVMMGAGIYLLNSSPTITNNIITGNVLQGDQKDYRGAGIATHAGRSGTPPGVPPATPVFTQNLIEGNVNISPAGQGPTKPGISLGGGIYVGYHSAPTIRDNTFLDNQAGSYYVNNQLSGGGGLAIYTAADAGDSTLVSGNLIQSNYTDDVGGGVAITYVNEFEPSAAIVENNLIEYNIGQDGGGAATRGALAEFRNNTFVDNLCNTGGGISAGNTNAPTDQITLVNNLVTFNSATVGGSAMYVYYADPSASYNDFFGDPVNIEGDKTDADYIGVDGNVSVDPQFVNRAATNRDIRLQSGSPVIDVGDNAAASALDLDGVPRVQDGLWDENAVVDMGAYEFSPDFDGDGTPDWDDDDDDDDGTPDTVDCKPFSKGVTDPPGHTKLLRLKKIGAGQTRLKWHRGGQGHTSNIYRGIIDNNPFAYNEACLLAEEPGQQYDDGQDPPENEGYYYLISAKNACGESPAGKDSGNNDVIPAVSCAQQNLDTDLDLIPDLEDNCPEADNPGQVDTDGDFVGDACDNCMDLPNEGQGDDDDDTVGDLCDNCPVDNNPGQGDTDGDTVGNVCDNCASVSNAGQEDFDLDGMGDVCDLCTDFDGDGSGDPGFPGNSCADDNCPSIPNPGQEDFDADDTGDVCDDCTDVDDDGYGNPGFPDNICPDDNCPALSNPGQEDNDLDGMGDVCDPDDDNDGFDDPVDNCQFVANDQTDTDVDGAGDACDLCTDVDDDGYGNPGFPVNTCPDDNCPALSNPGQDDFDVDGIGDVCDPDDDNDGVDDPSDCAQFNASAWTTPTEVQDLLVDQGASTTLSWTDQGADLLYDVAGGLVSVLRLDAGVSGAECVQDDVAATSWDDPRSAPGVDDGYYYLLRSQNACGDGTYGFASGGGGGNERTPSSACP